MGINGLLQGLKFCSRQGHVQEFANQSVAVDASSWLHKSVYSLADHYVEVIEQGKVDRRSINASSSYVIKRCEELFAFAKVKRIFLVMDGKRCPLKAVTNDDRERKRQDALKEARRFKRLGDKDKMYEKYKMCIKVRPELAEEVAKAVSSRFSKKQVEIVWSPYEADSQLVKLCMDNVAQAVITEDSDVLAYSAACQIAFPVLFKLDRNTGTCDIISLDWLISPDKNDLEAAAAVNNKKSSKTKNTGLESVLQAYASRQLRDQGLGVRLFVQSCVLSGCDYAPNLLDGVGTVTSFKQIRNSMHRDCSDRFRHALNLFPSKARKNVDKIEYEELLAKSEAVFFYHPVLQADGKLVYLQDPHDRNTNIYLPSLERFGGDFSFLGDVPHHHGVSEHLKISNSEASKVAPVREIVVVKSKHSRTSDGQSSQCSKDRSKSSSKLAKTSGPVYNPYAKARKRRLHDSDCDRVETNVPAKEVSSIHLDKLEEKNKENEKSSCKVLNQYLSSEDYRFVKRKFSRDDSLLGKFQEQKRGIGYFSKDKTVELKNIVTSNFSSNQDNEEAEKSSRSYSENVLDSSACELSKSCLTHPEQSEIEMIQCKPKGIPSVPHHSDQAFSQPTRDSGCDHRTDNGFVDLTNMSDCDIAVAEEMNSTFMPSHPEKKPGTKSKNNFSSGYYHNDNTFHDDNHAPSEFETSINSFPNLCTFCAQPNPPKNPYPGKRGKYDRSRVPKETSNPNFVASENVHSSFSSPLKNTEISGAEPSAFEMNNWEDSKNEYQSHPNRAQSVVARSCYCTRRVTLDSPLDATVGSIDQIDNSKPVAPLAAFVNKKALPSETTSFEYDDFLSSPEKKDGGMSQEDLANDDIMDSSQDSSQFDLGSSSVQVDPRRRAHPRANSTIGPAKTMRFRFGTIEHAFQRQKEMFRNSKCDETRVRTEGLRRQFVKKRESILSHFLPAKRNNDNHMF